ncbi:MAG: hypothetical protein KGI89_03380 [Euryarchaeota archaeon]|nr:hypothetical protein [Euryarchaeota archaeon]
MARVEDHESVEGCALPSKLLYDLELDVWARPGGDGRLLTFGIMSPLASFAGKFLEVSFRRIEGALTRGQSVATIVSARFTGAVRVPAGGQIVERNPELSQRPKLLNNDPYGQGWVATVDLGGSAPLPPTLRDASHVREEVVRKVREMHIRCYPAVPDVELFEIGSECSAVLAHLDDEVARRAPEEVILLVADDPTAPIELERWRMRTGHSILHWRKEENLYHFLVRRERAPRPSRPSP